MNMNRRLFLTSSLLIAGTRITPSFAAHAAQDVTSGGLGLTLADIQSLYEEGPVGQSFRTFIEPDSGASLYIDFGMDDLAQTIYVSGAIDESQVDALVAWLVLDDVQDHRAYATLTSAGSIAESRALTMVSPSLAEYTNNRTGILATWQLEPDGAGGTTVANLIITLQQEGVG